ncbi:MAG: Ger(x)C family spore germination C-terminal domain-containing protein [Candidatus Ventricola sp.]
MKRLALILLLLFSLPLLSGCGGGQEIESCLFVLSMAVDPAPDGNMTVTIKALSGTQEDASSSGSESSSGQEEGGQDPNQQEGQPALEATEPGYIVLSATAPSCLRALSMLSATTPRTVNLSQLREIVISRALAETDATLSILKEIHSMYRANGEAIVVVTPDDAGDFIRRQRAILGVRLSKYLEVLFEHFSEIDTIPPDAQLASVIHAMESDTIDAAAVYAAGNAFDSTLVLSGSADLDRLPGHLPRTSPAENEYLGAALFSGPRMVGTLTGEETGLLCLMMGKAQRRTTFIGSAQYKTNLPTRVRRMMDGDGALHVRITMNLTRTAGEAHETAQEIAADIERSCVSVLLKLRAASCDAAGFGRLAVRRCLTVPQWEALDWPAVYETLPVRVSASVKVL